MSTSAARGGSGGDTGGASPRAAVERFLGAVKAQDLQAIAVVWGTDKGPARDRDDRENVEKAAFIMQCYLGHEQFRIVNEATQADGKHVFRVALTKGSETRETNFYTVQGPNEKWYVEQADLEPVKDLRRLPPNQCAG
ncbi:MAG: hypothetical protein ABR543_13615 [Gemmatimonadaceae bacterium]